MSSKQQTVKIRETGSRKHRAKGREQGIGGEGVGRRAKEQMAKSYEPRAKRYELRVKSRDQL